MLGCPTGARFACGARMKTSEMVTKDELKAELDIVVQAMRHETGALAARIDRIEARLATVATKQQLDDAVSKVATTQQLDDAVSMLATKQQLAEGMSGLATKQQLADGVSGLATKQQLEDGIRTLSEQIAALTPRGRRRT